MCVCIIISGRMTFSLSGIMHSPSVCALPHLEHYCIILMHTLKYLLPDKCVIKFNIT